jgi:lipid A ethanolaminephosphotransferase
MRFFTNVLDIYPLNIENSFFLLSLVIFSVLANIIILSLACYKYTIKPILILILLLSSFTAYFMDSYNVIINDSMIDNVLKTDFHESLDLVSIKLFLYLILLGILPAIFIYRINIHDVSLKTAMFMRVKLIGFTLFVAVTIVLIFGNFYASFFREHKSLRYYSNPSYYLYSTGKYINSFFKNASAPIKIIALDAKILQSDEHRELVIFVLGETARADHFSLNGYSRKTNPYLEKEDVVSFTNVWSCGTSTAYSVPCIFSISGQSDFSNNKANTSENILDILQRTGVNVIWLDNNSSSKGVADRVPYESYKSPDKNSICDIECRDEGMLINLQAYIDTHPQGDIFIVLHQMGNHGPAYYKRYPEKFKKFKPVCETNQLEQCSNKEISNAYDNALLYTDYFLHKTIALLKKNSDEFESAMFYISDHGESLGESGIYLHGLPYILAPDVQKNVPLIMWFSGNNSEHIKIDALKTTTRVRFSHDNIFHTILGLMEIETDVYDDKMDMITHNNKHDE